MRGPGCYSEEYAYALFHHNDTEAFYNYLQSHKTTHGNAENPKKVFLLCYVCG